MGCIRGVSDTYRISCAISVRTEPERRSLPPVTLSSIATRYFLLNQFEITATIRRGGKKSQYFGVGRCRGGKSSTVVRPKVWGDFSAPPRVPRAMSILENASRVESLGSTRRLAASKACRLNASEEVASCVVFIITASGAEVGSIKAARVYKAVWVSGTGPLPLRGLC